MSASAAIRSAPTSGFYHCSVKNVGRAKGRSVVAAAAYRSGERLDDEITGQIFDYRARGGVIDTFILTPDNAPAWAQDRARLWNEAERVEARANGRLATEFELALPHELDAAHRRQLVKDFLDAYVKRHGVAADVAIHEPGEGRDHRNVHAHVLITHRALDADGFGDIANTRMMARKRKGQDAIERVAGIAATPADIQAIRIAWEQEINRAYERAGLDIRADHRSHEERGIDQEPSKHFGPAAAEMERRGKISERGDLNRDIAQRNADRQAVAAIEAEEQMLTAQIIDLKAERAMREARDAAKGRYDRLHETHRDVARDQFPGRYDDLRAAEPPHQVEREFTSNANRTAEPAAPIYDRDADNAEWEAKVADAAIGKDAGETRQQPADRAGKDATAETRGPSGEQHDRPEPQDTRPLSKAASEILTAWTLSRSAQQLEDALAARGIALAQVSPAEAEQSQRTAAFAKEVGNFAGVLKAGEIVAVTEHGDVHRLNQRTTGDPAPDIEARFPGIDRAALLNVADTKEVMQEAARATWRDERQAEREAARPATGIESMIADALKSTATGRDFAAAIDKEGLTIARVSEADVKALDALRQDAALAAVVAHTEAETDNVRHFATVQYGDLAAVTRAGDVFRVSPHHLDLTEIEHRLTEVEPRLPSVVEARAQSEINRETEAGFWAELREWYDEVRKDRADAIEGERALHSTVSTAEHTVEGMLDATEDALDVGSRAAGGAIGRLAKAVESILGGIFSFFGAAEPKLSPMQAELAARAADELAEARAGIAYEQAQDAARVAQIFAQDKQQQREQLERDTGLRERPGDRERERERER